jgi:hypothetical protein
VVLTVPLLRAHPLPSDCSVILVTRHTLLLTGRLATVVNKHHIAYSMHVTILKAEIYLFSFQLNENWFRFYVMKIYDGNLLAMLS